MGDVANNNGSEKVRNEGLEFLQKYDEYELILKKIKNF